MASCTHTDVHPGLLYVCTFVFQQEVITCIMVVAMSLLALAMRPMVSAAMLGTALTSLISLAHNLVGAVCKGAAAFVLLVAG